MKITANGNHTLESFKAGVNAGYVIYSSGSLGAATAALTYKDEGGAYVPITDGAIVIGEQMKVDSGANMELFVTVTGADGSTSINITSKSF